MRRPAVLLAPVAVVATLAYGCATIQVAPDSDPPSEARRGRTLVVADVSGWGSSREDGVREERARARRTAEEVLVKGLRGWSAAASYEALGDADPPSKRDELARRAREAGFEALLVLSLDDTTGRQARESLGPPPDIARSPYPSASSTVGVAPVSALHLTASLVALDGPRQAWSARVTVRGAIPLAETAAEAARKVARALTAARSLR